MRSYILQTSKNLNTFLNANFLNLRNLTAFIAETARNNRGWVLRDCVLPFTVSRLALIILASLSGWLPVDPASTFLTTKARGWAFTTHKILDVWVRWDSGWYLRIIKDGYTLGNPYQTQQSSIAFFPLYPYTVKAINFLLEPGNQRQAILIAIGVVLSNLCLLASLILLYLLVKELFNDLGIARRTVIYLLIFPTSFFLSSFYAEGMFLFLSLAALYAGFHRKWFLAGLAAGLLAVTRPPGIWILAPLLILYFQSIQWKLSRMRPNILWFSLAPLSLAAYFAGVYPLSGNFLAPVEAQLAWGRRITLPWESLWNPVVYNPALYHFEQFIAVFAVIAIVFMIVKMRVVHLGLYAFLLLMTSLAGGTLTGLGRHVLIAFPVLIVMASWGRIRAVDWTIKVASIALLILFWTMWCRFYMII